MELISIKFDFLCVAFLKLLNFEGTYVLLWFQSETIIYKR